MKNIYSLLLSLILLLGLCACGQAAATWQEQYDLGVKYLSDGNYEEAIIAFTAAIEIDSKRPDAYLGAADAYIGSGDYAAAADILQQGRQAGLTGDSLSQFEEAVSRYESILGFLNSEDTGIRITNFRFDKENYLAGEPTRFLVSVAYRCPVGEECIVMIGANTEEPDSFRMLKEDYSVTGGGGYQFDVTVTPRQWDGQLFGIYVNLSEADHGENWTPLGSDTLYIDRAGNVMGDFASDQSDPAEETGFEAAAQATGTLSLSDLSYSFDPNDGVVESNEGAVGGVELRYTVNGPANVRSVLISFPNWDAYPPDDMEAQIARWAESWKEEGVSVGNQTPPYQGNSTFPVYPDELGTTMEVVLVGLDENGDATGYAIVSVDIP